MDFNACMSDARTAAGWLSTTETATELGITPRTVYALINRGELDGHKFGRVIRVRRSAVDDLIERTRIQPGDLDHLLPGSDDDGPADA